VHTGTDIPAGQAPEQNTASGVSPRLSVSNPDLPCSAHVASGTRTVVAISGEADGKCGDVPAVPCSQRFGRDRRLLDSAAFGEAFRHRPLLRSAHFALHGTQQTRPGPARLGVVIAKRLAKRAVTRNLVRRLVRESFRQMPPPHSGFDCVLRLSATLAPRQVPAATQQIKRLLRQELQKLWQDFPARLARREPVLDSMRNSSDA